MHVRCVGDMGLKYMERHCGIIPKESYVHNKIIGKVYFQLLACTRFASRRMDESAPKDISR